MFWTNASPAPQTGLPQWPGHGAEAPWCSGHRRQGLGAQRRGKELLQRLVQRGIVVRRVGVQAALAHGGHAVRL